MYLFQLKLLQKFLISQNWGRARLLCGLCDSLPVKVSYKKVQRLRCGCSRQVGNVGFICIYRLTNRQPFREGTKTTNEMQFSGEARLPSVRVENYLFWISWKQCCRKLILRVYLCKFCLQKETAQWKAQTSYSWCSDDLKIEMVNTLNYNHYHLKKWQ